MIELDEDKFANTVLYLLKRCPGPVPGMTKLLKMLHLVDWTHYRRHLRPITNGRYVALQRGPVLDRYEDHFGRLERRGIVSRNDVVVHGHASSPKAEYLPLQEPDETAFDESEIEVMDEVIAEYGHQTGYQLSQMSHAENGIWSWAWSPDQPGRPIPYVLVRWLENWCDDKDMDAAKKMVGSSDIAAVLKTL